MGQGWSDPARILLCPGYDARNGIGVLRIDRRTERNFRELPHPITDRGKRYGFSLSEYAVLLVLLDSQHRDAFLPVRRDRSCQRRIDLLPAIECPGWPFGGVQDRDGPMDKRYGPVRFIFPSVGPE